MKELLKQKAAQTTRGIYERLPKRTKSVFLAVSAIGILSAGAACGKKVEVEVSEGVYDAAKTGAYQGTQDAFRDLATSTSIVLTPTPKPTEVAQEPATPRPAATAKPPTKPAEQPGHASTVVPPSPTVTVGFPRDEYEAWKNRTPTPESAVSLGFGIKLDRRTNKYNLIDRNTGQMIDPSALAPAAIIRQNKTGAGINRTFYASISPGETAIVEGRNVNGHDGAFMAIENPADSNEILEQTFIVTDGAVTIVSIGDGPILFTQTYNRTVDNGLAHGYVNPAARWSIEN